jgi:LmbE family N-acetylglucosaminyl deacetylase
LRKIVAVGAHPDDIELGMGGTIAKHCDKGDDVNMIVCTLGGVCGDPGSRKAEAEGAAEILGAKLRILDYPVQKLNKPNAEFQYLMKTAVEDIHPERVYVNSPFDYHQVHVAVSKCVLGAASNVRQVLYYECISSTSPDFKPNAYVEITDYIDSKLQSIGSHRSQRTRLYLQSDIVKSLARTRYVLGKLGSNPNGMAEAFTISRFTIGNDH